LAVLPAETIAGDPNLLMLQAELAWLTFEKPDAIRQATLAVRLGELTGDGTVAPSMRSLLAGMRVSVGDFSGAIADLAPFLDAVNEANANDLADVLFAAIPAYGFSGDAEGLAKSLRAAQALTYGGDIEPSRLARLENVMGVVADVVQGDPERSIGLFQSAARSETPQRRRATALSNTATSAISAGDLSLAQAAQSESAAVLGTNPSFSLDRDLSVALAAMIDVLRGRRQSAKTELEKVLAGCETEGERFTVATTCTLGSIFACASRDADYAHRLAERGIREAAAGGSPVLLWLAELVHAQASLALGDVDRARATASRILPHVEPIGAMGHVLHARLILAQSALVDGDLGTAVQHVSAVSDYIVDKSPALIVASYVRAFPALLGPLSLAMGAEMVPVRVLNLLHGEYAAEALQAAASVLTPAEVGQLASRMRAEEERIAAEKAAEAEAVCTVRLFGGLEVVTPRGQIGDRDWMKRKARLLFAMLVSRQGSDVPRGEIIEYLWPDMEEERGLNNFYVVWSAMKHALTPGAMRDTPSPFVEHVHGVCRIAPRRVDSDLQRFGDLVAAARHAREVEDVDAELAALRSLAELYRGEVLPGDVYDDWFAPLRERFRHDFEDAMMRAASLLEVRGDPRAGLALLRQATAHDPWREDLYQASLRLQIAAGQRSAAIETYMSCRNRLVEDLGIDPSRETTALYEQVLGMEEGLSA
jgi:DNA-binding SARP family transcriptional activator/tetratricopeptide (TPR) repeat protein